ncbi:MAG: hypothetical protein NT040_13995 [Bacteroidetes bacterium]|nr:hypothetical protein [Bacteroidota bacterium]
MNTSEIEALLEKFYEGDTSLGEEMILRDYFLGPDVPVHLKPHQPLFECYRDEQLQELGDRDFEHKLTTLFATEPAAMTPVVQLHPARHRMMFITGIAASIVILVGLFFTFQNEMFKGSLTQQGNAETEIAYADASAALMLVSGNLNHGLKQAERLQMVDRAMKNMQLFNKFYQAQTLIINPDEISNKSIKTK